MRRDDKNADELTYQEEEAVEVLFDIFFSRCAMVVWLIFASCLMAGVSFWKAIVVGVVMSYLYNSGFGIRWLERLAFVVTVCAAIYFVEVIPFDKLATKALALAYPVISF
jgi:hypothetical protein